LFVSCPSSSAMIGLVYFAALYEQRRVSRED
jgi:hypothetical protein